MIKQAEKTYAPLEVERQVQEFWNRAKVYAKTVAARSKGEDFYFGDGPPYTTGSIHLGNVLNKSLKDAVIRFRRMRGFHVRDQPGYDMHGLPIEVQVEKTLGITNKKEIEDLGIEKFVSTCRTFAVDLLDKMTGQFRALGIWMDWDRPYMTIRNEFIEAAWWTLGRAHERGLLYEALRSTQWCSRDETALADAEVEYSDETDPSIYVKFPLRDRPAESLLIWTTTPWTLPANLAIAVHPQFVYSKVKVVRGIPLDDGGDACHRHGPRRRDRLRGRRDDDRRQAGRPGLCAPARGQGPLSGDRDGGMGPSRGLLEHRRGGAHGSGPQRAGSRSRRFQTRPDPRLTGLQSGRRTRPFHERGGRVRRQAGQRGGRGDHRGPPRRERSLRRGDAGPCLRSLLALQDANPLPRDGPVVPASRADQGENGRRGPPGRVVSGMGGRGPSNGLDPEPAGLVPLPPAVLGDSAPHLAVHELRPLDRRRLLGCVAEGAGVRGRHGPAPAGDRPGRPALSEVPRGDAAGPRHPRCLVGQRGGELGEPRISRAGRRVPPVVAGGLDRRGSRPDSGLVQLAARRRRRRLRPSAVRQRPHAWMGQRPRRPADAQVPRERHRAGDRRAQIRGRRASILHALRERALGRQDVPRRRGSQRQPHSEHPLERPALCDDLHGPRSIRSDDAGLRLDLRPSATRGPMAPLPARRPQDDRECGVCDLQFASGLSVGRVLHPR